MLDLNPSPSEEAFFGLTKRETPGGDYSPTAFNSVASLFPFHSLGDLEKKAFLSSQLNYGYSRLVCTDIAFDVKKVDFSLFPIFMLC